MTSRARAAALGLAAAFLAVGAAERDLEAVAFGALTAGAAGLTLVRRGLPGRTALALIALDTLAWMGPAVASNAGGGQPASRVLVPLALAALAGAVLLLVAGLPPAPALAGVLAVTGAALALAAASAGPAATTAADVRVEMENVRFSPRSARVRRGGTLAVRNDDLFWHTWTVRELGIDVRVATGATRRVVVEGTPGTYRVVCAVPGHERAGMTATIVVE